MTTLAFRTVSVSAKLFFGREWDVFLEQGDLLRLGGGVPVTATGGLWLGGWVVGWLDGPPPRPLLYSLHSVTALKGYEWAENFSDGVEVQGNMITSMGVFAVYVNARRAPRSAGGLPILLRSWETVGGGFRTFSMSQPVDSTEGGGRDSSQLPRHPPGLIPSWGGGLSPSAGGGPVWRFFSAPPRIPVLISPTPNPPSTDGPAAGRLTVSQY